MTKGVRILIGFILLVTLMAVVGFWLAADFLLDDIVRPWLSDRVAAELSAEVRLEHLEYSDGRLILTGLSMERPDAFHFKVESIWIRFNWTDLLQRRISEVLIRQPQLAWSVSKNNKSMDSPTAWPQEPPVIIDVWRLENGAIELHWGDRQVMVHQLAGEGGLNLQFPIAVSAQMGPTTGASLRFAGQGHWQNSLSLALDELAWNDKNLLVQPLIIRADAIMEDGVRLGLDKLDDKEFAGLLAALDAPQPWPAELHWQMTVLDIELRLLDERLDMHLQTGSGVLQMPGHSWPWQSLRLNLQGSTERLEVTGKVGLAGSSTLALDGTWANQQLCGTWDITVDNLGELLQSLDMSIPASNLTPHELKLHGLIEAGHDAASISDIRLTTSLGTQAVLAGNMHAIWHDERLALAIEHLVITARKGGGPLVEGTLTLKGQPSNADWQGRWSLQVADSERLAQICGVALGAGVPNVQALTLAGGLQWRDGRLRIKQVVLTGRLSGSQASGRLHGQLNLEHPPGHEWLIILDPLTLEDLEYQASDGMAGLVGGVLHLKGRIGLSGDAWTFNLSGQAKTAEALWQSWYGNLAALPLQITVRGRWFFDQHLLELEAADLDLAGLVKIRCSGSAASGEIKLKAKADIPQLEGDFEKIVKDLAGELLPDMNRLSMGGQLLIEGAVRAQEDLWALDLAIEPVALHIAWDKIAHVVGLSGHFPVHLHKGAVSSDEPAESATLQWVELKGGLLESSSGRLDIMASTNRWRQQQPLELSAAGGKVKVTSLQIDLPNMVPQLRASLDLNNVELLKVSRYLNWPDMGGLLSARLAEIHVAGDEIRTVGDASMQAFGGVFAIGNMRVEAPFSRFPTYHADVDFSGIDLHLLTNTFAFGEMNGIADGYIHELRLFDGTPSAFKAHLETRLVGTRNISVKAIRNLNTLSQGGLSAALSHGIYQFIDFYHYRKIGILCSLQNDQFHLEGSGKAGSNQYLIYGGLLPPRIDVVVSSPTISFKEMVRRLKRIERAER